MVKPGKFAYPDWFYPLVVEKPCLTFGLPRDVFILMVGIVEFTMGFGMIWTPLVRRLSAIALFVIFNAAVYPFGRIDLIGHAFIMAIIVAIAVCHTREIHFLPALKRRLAGVPAGLIAALVIFATVYWGLYIAICAKAGRLSPWARWLRIRTAQNIRTARRQRAASAPRHGRTAPRRTSCRLHHTQRLQEVRRYVWWRISKMVTGYVRSLHLDASRYLHRDHVLALPLARESEFTDILKELNRQIHGSADPWLRRPWRCPHLDEADFKKDTVTSNGR